MRKIKIGYFADGPWAHLAFEKIIKDKTIEIAFIIPRIDSKDQTLFNYAKQYKIDYFSHENINSEEFIKKISIYDCDLLVSMSFNQIFRLPIINLTPNKIINCHAGKLPFYRGRNILNWALINDEKELGITVHYVDKGIDTGDIILQKTFEISNEDNYQSLLNLAFVECANIVYEAIKKIQDGDVRIIKQSSIHPIGMYCGVRGVGDELIDWNQTSRDLYNFIRAISSPGPKAQSVVKRTGAICKINSAEEVIDAPVYKGTPGQIIGKDFNLYIVKTKDSFIKIRDIDLQLGSLKVGDRFI